MILDIKHPNEAFIALQNLLKQGRANLAESISKLGYKYRRLAIVEDAYKSIFSSNN